MAEFQHHIFICENFRNDDHPRGSCGKMGSKSLRDLLKSAINNHKNTIAGPVRFNTAGCLDQCEHGPVAVIYPQGIWYGNVKPEDCERIVTDTIVKGQMIDDLVIAPECLNNPGCPHRQKS
ncbi:MAG: (2Fe-2S) ferredoxin domain-containing protein [bacterium]